MSRTYTVAEVDDLRYACELRWLFGTTKSVAGTSGMSRSYNELEKVKCVEELVRTAMIAGHTAIDLFEADNKK